MTTGAAKALQMGILDLWSRGPMIQGLFTDLTGDIRRSKGDSIEIPYFSTPFTVHRTESANPAATTPAADTLSIDEDHFVNQAVTNRQYEFLLGGNGAFVRDTSRRAVGDYINDIDNVMIEKMLRGMTAADHHNLDLSAALSDKETSKVLAAMIGQDGAAATGDYSWLASPWASVEIKSFANYAPMQLGTKAQPGEFGLPRIGTLDGRPYFEHSGVPGSIEATRLQSAVSASSVTSNVLTVTLASATEASKWVVGQQVYTSGMTANVALASPATITAISGANVSFALTAADGSNGTGTLYSATSMLFLIKKDWVWVANTGAPRASMINRENDAGYAMQLVGHTGLELHTGAVKVLHLPSA